MKVQTKWVNVALKMFLGLVFTAPVFLSCANLDEVWDKFDEVDARLDSLENSLNDQIKAFDDFISGQATITQCKKKDNGSLEVVLSSGVKFTVFPESASTKPLLTYVEENDVKYWAMYTQSGDAVTLKDSNGDPIPVQGQLPVVEKVDGEYVLTIGGESFVTGESTEDILTIFTGYELNQDDSGNVYSVTFTFGEDMSFTISVDGYKGFSFHMVGDVNEKVIKDYYIAHGETVRVKTNTEDVIDYVMQIPDGWRVNEVVDEYTKETFLDITAPSIAAVEAESAVASGYLKVVAVVDGGKSMVAKLHLSSEPFKKFVATSSHAVIEKYNGVDKVLYGLSVFSDFDKDQVMAGAMGMLQENSDGVSDSDVNVLLSTLLGEELTTGERYVLWAIPVFYKADGEDAGYYVKDGLILTYSFGAISATVNVEEEDILFNDVKVSVKLSGFTAYYGGTDLKTDDLFTEIIYQINNDIEDSYTTPMSYEGSVFKFPSAVANQGLEVLSEETYVTWIVPVVEGKTEYVVDDIIYEEYTLPGVTSGGDIKVTAGTEETGKVDINLPLTAEGASRIYYLWLTQRAASRIAAADRADYLLSHSSTVITDASSVVAKVDQLDPETKMTIFAMAVDSKGRYGEVFTATYTTDELVNNNLTVNLQKTDVGQDRAIVAVSSKGGTATEYLYWAGRVSDEFWVSMSGANVAEKAASAGRFMALYPEDSNITRVMKMYPLNDGVLTLTDLIGGKDYVVVAVAKDKSGNYSLAGYLQFTTMTANLGVVVRSTDDLWKTAKQSIQASLNFFPEKYGEAGDGSQRYAFNISTPKEYTAYIVCGSHSYFKDNPNTQTVEEIIIYMEKTCARPFDASWTPVIDGQNRVEPDWFDDNGVNRAQLMNCYNFYVHGFPTNGFATYFAEGSHIDHCTSLENGTCSGYERALQSINKRLTLDYYKEFVKGRGLKNQAVIDAAAQVLLDAYTPYYENAEPLVYENSGAPLYMEHHYGLGADDNGVVQDAVYVVLKDKQGNYFEAMKFEVPNYFK